MPMAAPTMPHSLIGASKQRVRRISAAARGAAEHAAEIADVLAEHDDVGSRSIMTSMAR
jgi:nicotinic acid phosphoribosyltransferase